MGTREPLTADSKCERCHGKGILIDESPTHGGGLVISGHRLCWCVEAQAIECTVDEGAAVPNRYVSQSSDGGPGFWSHKEPPDPRTPGQVAYEARREVSGESAWLVRWEGMDPRRHKEWEHVAAAVLAHGMGLLYVPFTSPNEPADGRGKL